MIYLKQFNNFITQISEVRGLSVSDVENALLEALSIAYKKDSQLSRDVIIKAKKTSNGEVKFYLVKTVIDDQDAEKLDKNFNSNRNILLSEAKKINDKVAPGQEVYIELPFNDNFSRVAAQTAKQVIIQKLREIEKQSLFSDFKEKEGKVISGVIEKRDQHGNVYVNLGKVIGTMFKSETIVNEIYRPGQRMRFYVYAVEQSSKGVQVFLSRAHSFFVPAIFAVEVPEIVDGTIEIKSVAREPGIRTKLAVFSKIPEIDPIGACIGIKGARIISVMNELNNEKIDIVLWDENPLKFVANALLPAKVVDMKMLPRRIVLALVSEEDIPLAIGKNGQNIKLAAKLTGWQIYVRSVNAPDKDIEGGVAEPENNEELS